MYGIDDEVSFEAATLTEPLSCALTGVAQLRTRPELSAIVLGSGPMGILYTHALRTRGIDGCLVEISAARRALAADAAARGWVACASIGEAVQSVSRNGTVDIVVDTTGVLSDEAIPLLARGGQFLAVGLRRHTAAIDMRRVADESLSIVGSIDSIGTFATAVHLINKDAVNAEAIVTHRLELEDFRRAFELLGCDIHNQRKSNAATAIKAVLCPP